MRSDLSLLTFKFSVPAGSFERFGVSGNYVRILSTDPAGAVLTLETFHQGRDGSKVPVSTGRDVVLGDFTEFRLTNAGANDVEVEMVAGYGRYRSSELAGAVAIDGAVKPAGDQFSEAGQAYIGYGSYGFAGGACNPLVQLWNSSLSDKNLFVDWLNFLCLDANEINGFITKSGCPNDTTSATYQRISNKLQDGGSIVSDAEASLRLYDGAGETSYPYSVTTDYRLFRHRATSGEMTFDSPIILAPGTGLTLSAQCDVGAFLDCCFQWREFAL